jgi:hypothetical protein
LLVHNTGHQKNEINFQLYQLQVGPYVVWIIFSQFCLTVTQKGLFFIFLRLYFFTMTKCLTQKEKLFLFMNKETEWSNCKQWKYYRRVKCFCLVENETRRLNQLLFFTFLSNVTLVSVSLLCWFPNTTNGIYVGWRESPFIVKDEQSWGCTRSSNILRCN